MAFQKYSDSEPNHCCMLYREFPLRQNPSRSCEHFFCSACLSVCCIMSLLLSHPFLPTPCLLVIIDYTAKAVIVCPCVWWVVWIKTELMGSTLNVLTVEELVGQWVHSDLSSSRDNQSKCWRRLIYDPKWTQMLPSADIMHMSEGN